MAGIGGFLFAAGGILYAYSELGVQAGNINDCISSSICRIIFWLLCSNSFNKVVSLKKGDSKLISTHDLGIVQGDEGIVVSRLNPMGKIRVKGITVEAKSN